MDKRHLTEKHFQKRHYHNLGQIAGDLKSIWLLSRQARSLREDDKIAPAFHERLMLAVTGVNHCRYCAYVHARTALNDGVTPEQIRALGDQESASCPAEELPALLYAQHWAESGGRVVPQARQRILDVYGIERTLAVERTLQMIQTANMAGNTWDYLLYRLGFMLSDSSRPDAEAVVK